MAKNNNSTDSSERRTKPSPGAATCPEEFPVDNNGEDPWGSTVVVKANAADYGSRRAGHSRDRARVQAASAKEYRLRGYNGANRNDPRATEYARKKRVATGTEHPALAKKKALLLDKLLGPEPCAPTTNIRHLLAAYKRDGNPRILEVPIESIICANERYHILTKAQSRALIQRLLLIAGVEPNPGPPKAKPGTNMGRENLRQSRGEPTKIEVIKSTRCSLAVTGDMADDESSPDENYARTPPSNAAIAAAASAVKRTEEDVKNMMPPPSPPVSGNNEVGQKDPASPAQPPPDIHTFEGHYLSEPEIKCAVLNEFYGDPDSIQQERAFLIPTDPNNTNKVHERRPVCNRNVQRIDGRIAIVNVKYTGVKEWVLWVPFLATICCAARRQGTTWSILSFAWSFVANVWFFVALGLISMSLWLNPLKIFCTLLGVSGVYNTAVKTLGYSTYFWSKRMHFTYVPHLITVATGSTRFGHEAAKEELHRACMVANSLNIPDRVYTDWVTASIKCAYVVKRTNEGFHELDESGVLSYGASLGDYVAIVPQSDSSSENSSGGALPYLRVQIDNLSQSLPKFVGSAVKSVRRAKSTLMDTVDKKQCSQVSLTQETETCCAQEESDSDAAKTSDDCPSDTSPDTPQFPVTEQIRTVASKVLRKGSEVIHDSYQTVMAVPSKLYNPFLQEKPKSGSKSLELSPSMSGSMASMLLLAANRSLSAFGMLPTDLRPLANQLPELIAFRKTSRMLITNICDGSIRDAMSLNASVALFSNLLKTACIRCAISSNMYPYLSGLLASLSSVGRDLNTFTSLTGVQWKSIGNLELCAQLSSLCTTASLEPQQPMFVNCCMVFCRESTKSILDQDARAVSEGHE